MMRPLLTLLAPVALAVAGCVGEAEFQLSPGVVPSELALPTTGPKPVQVGTFEGLSEGLPGARLNGTAQLDGALYTVASDGLFRLATGSRRWEPVTLGSKATSIVRIDSVVWVTAAD